MPLLYPNFQLLHFEKIIHVYTCFNYVHVLICLTVANGDVIGSQVIFLLTLRGEITCRSQQQQHTFFLQFTFVDKITAFYIYSIPVFS